MSEGFKKAFIPTVNQVYWLLVSSSLVLLATHYHLIEQRLLGKLSTQPQDFRAVLDAQIGHLIEIPYLHFVNLALFWGLIGLVSYTVLWALIGVAIQIWNLAVYEKYYVNKPSLMKRGRVLSLRLLLGLMVIGAIVITILYGMPFWFTLLSQFIFSPVTVITAAYLFAAVTGLAANIYLIIATFDLFLIVD